MIWPEHRLKQIDSLWDILNRDTVRYFAKRDRLTIGGLISRREIFRQLAQNLNDEWSLYVTLNTARNSQVPIKSRSKDISHWNFILIDVDPMTPDANPHDALQKCLLNANKLLGVDIFNSVSILYSGRGVQGWLKLDPMALEDEDLATRGTIERATAHFLRSIDTFSSGCRVDTACSDLARVARCPGSVNVKTGNLARFMVLGKEPLDPKIILDFAPPNTDIPAPKPNLSDASLVTVMPYLTGRAANFIIQGVITPGRHAACYAAAASLAECGIPMDRARAHLSKGAHLCTPPLPESAVLRAIQSAYQKRENENPSAG